MTEPLIISIDVMGGDFGPSVTLAGADMELKRRPEIRYELFGDEAVVKPVLDRYPTVKAASNFHHCEVTVAMDAKPSTALRHGRWKSSMWIWWVSTFCSGKPVSTIWVILYQVSYMRRP